MTDLAWLVRITMILVLVGGGWAIWEPAHPDERVFALIFMPPILALGVWLLRRLETDDG